jgi:hypothetical protein
VADRALVAAVKIAKRSRSYRSNRDALACVAPTEIWREEDDDTVFVLFELASASEMFLGFAVDPQSARIVRSGILSIAVEGDEWRVRHDAATDAAA